MLGARGVLRKARHRRVLSKSLRRMVSLNATDVTHGRPQQVPTYILFLASLLFGYYAGLRRSAFLLAVYSMLKRFGVFSSIRSTLSNYRNRTPQHGPTMREKCYYYVDYWLSTNPYAKALVLMALTCGLIFTSGTIISWMAAEPWVESLWAAALGSGLDWGFINSSSPSLRLVALCTNVGGLVLTALLLSIISDAVQTKYDSLRKGESSVTETGHTLIIGWSVKSLSVMTQLAKAGESVGSNVVVCLSDHREKEDMENDIAQCEFNFANVGTRVVCRSGSPLSHHDLRRVSFFRARSIIILGNDESDAETSDARSLQILLSIVSALEREKAVSETKKVSEENSDSQTSEPPVPERIVIEVMDTENAELMKSVSPELVEPVLANDVVGRLMLQAARNPLVADVWQELLGFDGCEIYSGQWGILRGLTFKEVLLCFEDAIPLGVKSASGSLLLNPADNYVIGGGDEIIVLAEDDESYCASITHTLVRDIEYDEKAGTKKYVDIYMGGLSAIRSFSRFCKKPDMTFSRFTSTDSFDLDVERILFCGWRFDMGNLLQVYSAVAPPGSEFWILSELSIEQREIELQLRGWESNRKVKVVHRVGACRRNVLAQLPLECFSSVIVGGSDAGSSNLQVSSPSSGNMEPSAGGKSEVIGEADSRVITVVMMIQDITTRKCHASRLDHEFDSLLPRNSQTTPRSGRWRPGGNMLRLESSTLKSMTSNATFSRSLSRARSQRFLGSKPKADINFGRGVIVGELLDSRSRAMLSVVNSIDAVVASSELISKAVAMVSEDSSVNRFLNTLFDPYDSEITLESVDAYVDLSQNERVSFFELMTRGRELGTIVLGYLERESLPSHSDEGSIIRYTEVKLNPSKKELRRGWHPDDLLIVLTPGPNENNSNAQSDNLLDLGPVRQLDVSNGFSWQDSSDVLSLGKRNKVKFHK